MTDRLYQRLEFLLENTNIFVVQRGGIGTFSELFLALDGIRKMEPENRPKIYLVGEIWGDVMAVLANTFIPNHEHELWKIVLNFEDLKVEMECLDEKNNTQNQSIS